MQQIKTPHDITQLGSILSVWAHPDDESYSCAGIMVAALQNGQQVACVTATKGEAGVQDESRWPAHQLGEIRAKELEAALKILGIKQHQWLGYPDGGCKDMDKAEAVNKLKHCITKYQPDSILTFGPDGMTGHDDHCTVSAWVSEAVKNTDIAVYHAVQLKEVYEHMRAADEQFNIFFNIDQPQFVEAKECAILIDLPEDIVDKKYRGLCAMPSQTEAMFKMLGHDGVCAMLRTEAFVRA